MPGTLVRREPSTRTKPVCAVGGDPGRLQVQVLRERAAADAHQELVKLQGFGLAVGFDGDGGRVARDRGALDLGSQSEGEALLLQEALQPAPDLAVHGRGDLREHLDHGDLGAQPHPDRAELEADVAAADNAQPARDRVEREGLGRAQDGLAVEGEAGRCDRRAARGQDDVLCFERFRLAPGVDRTRFLPASLCRALDDDDLVVFKELLHIVREVLDHLLLAGHHLGDIHADGTGRNPVARQLGLGQVEVLARVQERLARDAADVQAHPAEARPFFDTGRLQAELGRAHCGHIAPGAASNDHQVVAVGHRQISIMMRSGFSMHSLMCLRKVTASRPSTMR